MNSVTAQIYRWNAERSLPESVADEVAVEEPLEIRVNGRSVAVTMRTPGHDRELAAGFLLTEGVIDQADDLLDLLVCRTLPDGKAGNVVDAQVSPRLAVDFTRLTRHVFSSSSCGLCGKATLESVFHRFPAIKSTAIYDPGLIATLPERLRSAQPGFGATGGLHASALFDVDGELCGLREDVGRHNALDKVLGHALLGGRLPLSHALLLVSGRISFELMQKALAAGVPFVAGIGAPSSLAVDCARQSGQTLVGFLRSDRMNIYAGAERFKRATAEVPS